MRYPITFVLLLITGILFGQTADFSFRSASGGFCLPAPVSFTQQASGAIGFVWDFGDGVSSNDPNPSHTFSSEGIYDVRMTAIFPNTSKEVVKSIEILPASKVTIKGQWAGMCMPGEASFTATGNNILNFEWDFGDGSGTSTGTGDVTHDFRGYENYTVKVKATDNNGCISSALTNLKVAKPEITVTNSSVNYCVGINVDFKAQVKLPAQSKVDSYSWDFGDGNSIITTTANVSHPYAVKDEYAPTLSIVTNDGCTADLNMDHVFVGLPTTLQSASVLEDDVCASDPVHFIAESDDADYFIWVFDGSGSVKSVGNDLPHKFNTLGTHTATVYPYDNNGCAGSPLDVQIDIVGVIADFDFKFNCTSSGLINFTNQSAGNVTTFLWDFGDGVQDAANYNASHTFAPNDTYGIKLEVEDAITGCSYSVQKKVSTVPAAFENNDNSICRSDETVYKIKNLNENTQTNYTYFVLNEMLPPTKFNTITHSPGENGIFSDYVIIDNGPRYCQETVFLDHKITVRGPVMDFDLKTDICMGDSVEVINKVYPFLADDLIKTYSWSIGDEEVSSDQQPSPWHFTKTGNYNIKLFAEDINGCVDNLIKTVALHGLPFLRITHELDEVCEGSSDQLTVFHNDPVTWSSNESLPCNDCDVLDVFPVNDAYYAAEALSKDGCVSRDTVFIKVYNSFNAVALNPNPVICVGDTVSLRVAPADLNITWLPGEHLSSTTEYAPVASPVVTTEYTAVLTDEAGCFTDEAHFNVTVNPPAVISVISDTTVPYMNSFKLKPVYSSNVVQYLWSPRGNLDCLNCPDPGGVAEDNYTYVVRATTDLGCTSTDSVTVFIQCSDDGLLMPNAFSPNDDNLNDVLYPIGRGIRIVRKFLIFDRYGQIVFQRENFLPNRKDLGWNGRIKGEQAPTSVYVFMVEAECGKGETIIKKGAVSLLR